MTKQEQESLVAQIAELTKQNEALKASKAKGAGPSCKVTAKGGVSFYGVGRFPVTLYKQQWIKLLAHADMINAFLAENDEKLTVKESTKPTLKIAA